jgi:sulfoxide reductase heme-binding subunit YedZ
MDAGDRSMRRFALPQFARYQLLVHLAALMPLAWLAYDALMRDLTANPIQAIEQRTGKYALILLVASLACTPLNIVTGWSPALRWRRPLGLYAFMYAALHFVTFIGLDYGFDLGLLWADVAGKRYIFVGAAALLILLALALTSTKGLQRRLGKAWKRLHRWVYAAGGLVIAHYVWAVKSDIRQPLAWGAVIAALLVLRLPPVKRWFAVRRGKRRSPPTAQSLPP